MCRVPVTEIPTEYPELPREVYEAQHERHLRKRMESEGLDAVGVYHPDRDAQLALPIWQLWPPL